MEWTEVDFGKAVWIIPEGKMKMRQPYSVPLSRQSLAILNNMRTLSGSGRYVFPSIRSRTRPISENTINAALRRMGYPKDQMTAHGFRTSASSLLNESGKWNPDAIERALAHMVAGSVRRIGGNPGRHELSCPYVASNLFFGRCLTPFLRCVLSGF